MDVMNSLQLTKERERTWVLHDNHIGREANRGNPVNDLSHCEPEFGRWRDVERLFGIKRGVLYSLAGQGVIKSVSLRRKGNVHGCRLFYLPSVSAYLHSLMTDQKGGVL